MTVQPGFYFSKWIRAAEMGFTVGIAWAVRLLVPTRHWYRTTFQVSQMLGPTSSYLQRHQWNGSLSQAVFVNRVLAFLTRTG